MATPGSSRSTSSLMPGRIVIAFDATKTHATQEFKDIVTNIRMRDGMIQEVDTITVLGVLHKVLHPMGFQIQIDTSSFVGARVRAIKEEVSRMVDKYVGKLQYSAEECVGNGVTVEVKIIVGAPLKKVIVQEAVASNATWVVLNRHLRKEISFYLKHIPCKVAVTLDNFGVEVLRPYYSDKVKNNAEHKLFYSRSKVVPLLSTDNYNMMSDGQSVISCMSSHSQRSSDSEKSSFISSFTSKSKEQSFSSPEEFVEYPELENSDAISKVEIQSDDSSPEVEKQRDLHIVSESRHACNEMKTSLESNGLSYSEIQRSTDDFSSDNLLGKGRYGDVYKGRLKDGQPIIVKLQKEENVQGFSEFHSEVCELGLVCHKNIVMLLSHCCKEKLKILVYEYACNNSLEWHLFSNAENILDWHRRHAIAIGIAKGLRYLHKECRGSPIVHRDIRPSNIFLTHEYVPMLADCGLAKWRRRKGERQTKNIGPLEYLAPEYAENGFCSEKTDIFAFGIVLLELISGRKAVDSIRDNHNQSLRQWATPLIQKLALDELVDPRLGESYSTYEVYQMARAARQCTQTKPALRPTVGEVLHLLEGKNDHLQHLTEKFTSHFHNIQTPLSHQAFMA